MIKFKTVSIRNFMSFGNIEQTLSLESTALSLIIGENLDTPSQNGQSRNGVGKSTLINALCYGLYGNALSTIKKDNLVNITNEKNMVVNVVFEKDGKEYKIIRGRKPNIFKFFVDNKEKLQGIDEAQGENKETQDEIEKILSISYEMFKQVIGFNTTTPAFLSLPAKSQRDLIEELLGITQLTEKAEMIKDQIKETKDALLSEEVRIKTISKSNEAIQKTIIDIQQRKMLWDNKKQAELQSVADALEQLQAIDINTEISEHNQKREKDTILAALSTIASNITRCLKQQEESDRRKITLKEREDKLQNKVCHTCGQNLKSCDHTILTEDLKNEIKKNIENSYGITEQLTEYYQQKIKLEEFLTENTSKYMLFYNTLDDAYGHKSRVETLESHILDKSKEENPFTDDMIEQQKNLLTELDATFIDQLSILKSHQEFVLKLLTNKDSFVRKSIIEQNLFHLNDRLRFYLSQLGLPHKVRFLSDLTVSITNFGRDLDYGNLSRGEQTRLTLGLSFAFRDVFEGLNSTTNLLFVDELLDQGLDSGGLYSTIEILKQMKRNQNRDVFVVSHHEDLHSKVDNIITITKHNGFSSFK